MITRRQMRESPGEMGVEHLDLMKIHNLRATSDVEHLRDNMAAGRGRMSDAPTRQRMVELIGLSGRPPWN